MLKDTGEKQSAKAELQMNYCWTKNLISDSTTMLQVIFKKEKDGEKQTL